MDPVKVAAVQAAPVLLDRDETIAKVVTLAGKAAAEGARLVAFPEAFVPGYPDWVWRTRPWDADATALYARLFDQAVVVGSPATDLLAETAARLGIWLSVGVDERDERDSTIYNTLLHFAPDGTLAARHRKLMPTGGERLVWGTGDGSTLQVVDTGFGRLGGLICWENYMPLARAALYAQGIDVYLAPTWDNSEVWVPTLRHIAREGRTYVIGVTSCISAADLPADLPGRDGGEAVAGGAPDHHGVPRQQAEPLLVPVPDRLGVDPERRAGHEHLGEHHELRPLTSGRGGQRGDAVDGGVPVHQDIARLDGGHPQDGHDSSPSETAARGDVSTIRRKTSLRL